MYSSILYSSVVVCNLSQDPIPRQHSSPQRNSMPQSNSPQCKANKGLEASHETVAGANEFVEGLNGGLLGEPANTIFDEDDGNRPHPQKHKPHQEKCKPTYKNRKEKKLTTKISTTSLGRVLVIWKLYAMYYISLLSGITCKRTRFSASSETNDYPPALHQD